MKKGNIIIIGAGFGGITAALTLAKKLPSGFSLTLINRHHHQLYTPSLYEIASIPKEITQDTALKSSILIPIDHIIKGKPIIFLCDECVDVNAKEKTVTLQKTGTLPYEYLILALGSETAYFDIPGLREYALPLKTFDDALAMRNAIEDRLSKKEELRIVVGGAGSAGIELVAEFVNFVCLMKEKLLPNTKKCSVFFTLVEASPDILPGFEPWVVELAKKRLSELGIRIKTNTSIVSVSATSIAYQNGETEQSDILIWTGGVKGPSLLNRIGLQTSPKGSLLVDSYLRAHGGFERIFAIGDNATIINPHTQKPLIWNVPAAEKEAMTAVINILRIVAGRPPISFVPAKKYPFILAVGEKYAIADLLIFRFWGLSGWIAKQLVEFRYLLFILPPHKALAVWRQSITISHAND
ncbi:MAG: FAD-dependent oxidoreductase [Candidatus Sungbacteria bacterium]|nr:FAD-dependent oxidoreductase [bacterium]MDZ4260143.1 FAD-dependent oxidoreductase [Candidatus Sungbacteria bacterium]